MGKDDECRAATETPAALTDWYSEGEGVEIVAGGSRIAIRFIGRRGRRGRIRIEAPPGAEFTTIIRRPAK